jgi:hypothetical protein
VTPDGQVVIQPGISSVPATVTFCADSDSEPGSP